MDQWTVTFKPMEHKPPTHADAVTLGPGAHTKVKRHADRAHYDAATVHAIIDEALYCHVSFVVDGQPVVLPTAHARIDHVVYLHGAAANHMFRTLAQGGRTCIAFTLLDGLVMARSAFNHSMNYRSTVVFGTGSEVTDLAEKKRALDAIVDHAQAGRSQECIAPTPEELKATLVVRVPIEEASAKVRSGPAIDYPHNVEANPCWAGVIPLSIKASDPIRDALLPHAKLVSDVIVQSANKRGGPMPIDHVEGELLFSTDKSRLDVALIHRFLSEQSYWAQGVSLARVQASIDASLCFGVYREGQQLAFARVLGDGGRFGYLGDVFVIAGERGHGISKRLVQFVLDHPEVRDLDRVLLGTVDAPTLYSRFGFATPSGVHYMVKASPRVRPLAATPPSTDDR